MAFEKQGEIRKEERACTLRSKVAAAPDTS